MIQLTELENGNLKVEIKDRQDFEQMLERPYTDERAYLHDMLDEGRYIGNDWYAPCNIALTEMPIIAYGSVYEENTEGELTGDEPIDYDKIWGYGGYMIDNYLEDMQRDGYVIFKKYE